MKTIALALVALIVASGAPARAQNAVAPAASAPQAEKPKPSCPCDNPYFKPLTDKARAVEAYWDARRTVKTASVLGGLGALFALAVRDPNALRESTEGFNQAQSKMSEARTKAVNLGALKVTGDDMDGTIEFKLVKGVDYTITP